MMETGSNVIGQESFAAAVDELIRTKVAPPVWLGDQIRRDLLLARLDDALSRRLTLIQAPAGYGKTSLLAQWRQRHAGSNVQIAWLTLETDDGDLKRLAGYLSLALAGGGAPADEASPVPPDLPPRAALSAIINRLAAEPRPVAIVFDDFHRADSPALSDFVSSLIRLAPRNCHFVVASRDHPALGQSVLAAEDQLLEFGAEDLRFSAAETGALLARHRAQALDDDDLRRIFERTEGWPIALQLVALSLKRGADPGALVARFSGSGSELARYLSEQVLVALPPDMQEAVVRTALVDRLTGEVVNLLCAREDGWLVLERLEHQGVFLAPLSEGGTAYRYHQLFAEYLRERLLRRDAAQYRALQHLLAGWFAARGQVSEAVNHALRADDHVLLADILERAGAWRLIPQGQQAVAARALDALPAGLVDARPRLALARIYLAIKRGELGAARADYDRLLADADGGQADADLRTEINIVGDLLLDYENAPLTLEDLLERETLLRNLPTNDHLLLANICELLGAKYYEGGWLERAMEPTLAAREHYQALGSLYSDLFTRFLEARIRRAQGRARDAANILAAARRQIIDNFGERSDLAANCAAFEAELLYEQDRVDEAAELLAWSLPHMEQSDGWVDVYAAAYATAARIEAARGAMEEALAMLSRGLRLARRRRLRQLELLMRLCELQLLLRGGDDERARSLADGIGLDALADEMRLEAAGYRQVAIAAALCRARLRLAEGAPERALEDLEPLRQWASRHGIGRLLLDANVLLAYAHARLDGQAKAQACFDSAVGMAMFQGLVRQFIDAQRFVEPLLRTCARDVPQGDRFRDQFLKGLTRAFAARPMDHQSQGFLSEAEVAVIEPLCRGLANKEIARAIGMSPDTVKYRLKALFRKIGVHRRQDAVRVLRERGLFEPQAQRSE